MGLWFWGSCFSRVCPCTAILLILLATKKSSCLFQLSMSSMVVATLETNWPCKNSWFFQLVFQFWMIKHIECHTLCLILNFIFYANASYICITFFRSHKLQGSHENGIRNLPSSEICNQEEIWSRWWVPSIFFSSFSNFPQLLSDKCMPCFPLSM